MSAHELVLFPGFLDRALFALSSSRVTCVGRMPTHGPRTDWNVSAFSGSWSVEHVGTIDSHVRALDGIVVDEDEAIQSQVQFLGEVSQIPDFLLQLMRCETRCSRLSFISDRWSKTSSTSLSLFLLHRHNSMPAFICSSMNACSAW